MSVMQVCFKYSASLCGNREGRGMGGGGWERKRDVACCKGDKEGASSGRVQQRTTGRWRCCPWPHIQRWDGRVGLRREGGARRSSGLEKVGVSDCQGHT